MIIKYNYLVQLFVIPDTVQTHIAANNAKIDAIFFRFIVHLENKQDNHFI
jgi:hypothetical protein